MALRLLVRLIADDRGQDLLEYALLTVAIGLAAIGTWDIVRNSIGNAYGVFETGTNNLWESPSPSGS